ncbi:LysR family transcriptional regulator [Mycolicibacterium agri]|uniref:Probable hydrogen peroxide-inducible genes activator n=1 Tax=Mycolicibacterium agri TaxID=36811 RepID=A0A2A7NCK0_MYCAG|nr:LysR substrate-binding domain-containing protein [Mycolicibacterium agri]PEG41765.1 LysR family transcriptional regulator [Mycolicibacterium agri]GFG49986.1 putative transcriptional regulator, LysR family protein [Mycolicibacterium agri]
MELRQLEYFIAVAAEMNFSRAAQQVHVVQSALSTSVSKLEKELNVELFDRSKQQIKITPAGELFREHARRVLQTARLAKDSMAVYQGELTGTVDLGSLISFGKLDVPKILGEFHQLYPFVRIKLRQSQTGSTAYLSAIADGSLDLALVSAPDRFPAGVEMQELSTEPMVFVCRPDHPLAHRDHVEICELADEDLIGFPTQFGLRRLVDDAFAAAGITAHVPYEVALEYHVAAGLVKHGLGTIFMPESEAARYPELCAVDVRPAVMWTIYLASAEPSRLAPASARLAKLLLAAADATSDSGS